MSTIPLSKGYKPEKLTFPVILSEKLDGVPLCLTVRVGPDGTVLSWGAQTRQGEVMYSAKTILEDFMLENTLFFEGFVGVHYIVGELVQTADTRAPFKDTSGIARRQEDQGNVLSLGIFDYYWEGGDEGYMDRFLYFTERAQQTDNVWVVPYYIVTDTKVLSVRFQHFMDNNKNSEGMVARSVDDTFRPGKRSWGYQKMLNEPTIDLLIVGCEEAKTAAGEPKGMAGRLVAQYKGGTIGIGPGKLTHSERVSLLEYFKKPLQGPRMAQIKYKADDSYAKLRQPTFQHWRDDKVEPDA